MSHHQVTPMTAEHMLSVFPANAFGATDGVNSRETISDPTNLCLGDAYTLRTTSALSALPITALDTSGLTTTYKVSKDNALEALGTRVTIAARLTFMTQIGASVDVLVVSCDGPNARIYLHPLGPLEPSREYMLIAVCDDTIDMPLSDFTGMSFGRGTRITTATGAQVPVEELCEGDRILTRDHGMQPIRWIGKRTVQGVGAFAPVVIGAGAMGNSEALIVSQSHRMMMSDWRAEVMTGTKDVLIEAVDLINDNDIYLRPGGFVEYTQLVFDQHQIIYAEGVASESLHLSPQLLSALPEEVAGEILKRMPKLQLSEPKFCRTPLNHTDARNFLRQVGRI